MPRAGSSRRLLTRAIWKPLKKAVSLRNAMRRTLTIQTCGSLVVIGGFLAAEIAARILTIHPSSPTAWYLNLEVFGAFERARLHTSLGFLFGPASVWGALAALLLTLLAWSKRHRLGVALAANFSFVFAAVLAFSFVKGVRSYAAASLVPAAFVISFDALLIGVMLLSSFVAVAVSHASYIAAIRAFTRRGEESASES
jgi:hypothetical protein